MLWSYFKKMSAISGQLSVITYLISSYEKFQKVIGLGKESFFSSFNL